MRLIDLSHRIEAGMITYKGLPAPVICDFLSRGASRPLYDGGAEFSIQHVSMVGNTGTYLDSPFHRYADGLDLADLQLDRLVHLETVVVDAEATGTAVDVGVFTKVDVSGRAVLVRTGWVRHWRTDTYFENHPFLTAAAAAHLADAGATLVGIDSHNIDDTRGRERPVHTILLGSSIPICEHMTGLDRLRHAVPASMPLHRSWRRLAPSRCGLSQWWTIEPRLSCPANIARRTPGFRPETGHERDVWQHRPAALNPGTASRRRRRAALAH